jgi:hypothetical protein
MTNQRIRTAPLVFLLVLVSCATPTADPSVGLLPQTVYDSSGQPHQPLQVSGDSVHVVIFTSHECPIAKGYSPTLRALADGWRAQNRVRLFLVHVDPDLTPGAAREHTAAYDLPGTVVLDPSQGLARRCGATITPEAVICTAQGIAYRGRIDDQWRKLGSRAPAASRHDLRDAVGPFWRVRACRSRTPRRSAACCPSRAVTTERTGPFAKLKHSAGRGFPKCPKVVFTS